MQLEGPAGRYPHSRLVSRTADGGTAARSDRCHGDLRCGRRPFADGRSCGKAKQCWISLMGPADAFPMDEKVESGGRASEESGSKRPGAGYRVWLAMARRPRGPP